MRALFSLAAVGFLGLAPLVPAALEKEDPPAVAPASHPSTDAVKKELTGVIEGQLAAFRTGDYAKAYTFAAKEIQGQFALAEFEMMVRRGYPAIAHSGTAEFGLTFDSGEEAVVNVRIEDREKRSGLYQYHLTKQSGQWKISGVTDLAASGLSV